MVKIRRKRKSKDEEDCTCTYILYTYVWNVIFLNYGTNSPLKWKQNPVRMLFECMLYNEYQTHHTYVDLICKLDYGHQRAIYSMQFTMVKHFKNNVDSK